MICPDACGFAGAASAFGELIANFNYPPRGLGTRHAWFVLCEPTSALNRPAPSLATKDLAGSLRLRGGGIRFCPLLLLAPRLWLFTLRDRLLRLDFLALAIVVELITAAAGN